jgi:hypothetical protein
MKKQIMILVMSIAGVLVSMAAWAGPPLPPPPPFGFTAPGFSLSINTYPRHVWYERNHRQDHHVYKKKGHRHRGHWEVRKVWVPPSTEKVWNPGHYNRRGHWVRGQWIEIERRRGYWKKEKVWVARKGKFHRPYKRHYR